MTDSGVAEGAAYLGGGGGRRTGKQGQVKLEHSRRGETPPTPFSPPTVPRLARSPSPRPADRDVDGGRRARAERDKRDAEEVAVAGDHEVVNPLKLHREVGHLAGVVLGAAVGRVRIKEELCELEERRRKRELNHQSTQKGLP